MTLEFADKYRFNHHQDLYFVTVADPDELPRERNNSESKEVENIGLQPYTADRHANAAYTVLTSWFDTSQQLAQRYIGQYQIPAQSTLHHYLMQNRDVLARITFSTFERDDGTRALSTIYISEEEAELLPDLLHSLHYHINRNQLQYDQLTIYLAGLSADKLELFIYMDHVSPALSFYRRQI